MDSAGFLLRVAATQNGRLRPPFVPNCGGRREVFVRHCQVMLVGDRGCVPQPGTDDVGWELLFQFRLPAGSAVLEWLGPRFYAGAADDSARWLL